VLMAILAIFSAGCGEDEKVGADKHSNGEHGRPSDSKVRSREHSTSSARDVRGDDKAWREANLEKGYVGKVRSMERMEVIAELDAGRISTLQELKALFPNGYEDDGKKGGFVFTVNIEGRDFIVIWADEFGRITGWQARDSY